MYLLSVTLQKPEVGTAHPLLPYETSCTLLRPTFVGLKSKLKIKSHINRGHYALNDSPSATHEAGVYILQKYKYYSPSFILSTIILPYVQNNFQLLTTSFRVDPPYY